MALSSEDMDKLLAEFAELERKKHDARKHNDREASKKAEEKCEQFLKEHPNLKTRCRPVYH